MTKSINWLEIFVIMGILLLITSCSPFSKFAGSSVYSTEKCPDSNFHLSVMSNQDLGISTLSFADFKFAISKKEFSLINPSQKPVFKDILFYGKTDNYDYYLLLNPKEKLVENYVFKDTIIGGKRYVIAASNSIHNNDFRHLTTNLYPSETDLLEHACF